MLTLWARRAASVRSGSLAVSLGRRAASVEASAEASQAAARAVAAGSGPVTAHQLAELLERTQRLSVTDNLRKPFTLNAADSLERPLRIACTFLIFGCLARSLFGLTPRQQSSDAFASAKWR